MPKTIFFNIPATGHINPSLPLMRELVARGEEVIYVNTEEHRAKIEATGVRFEAYPVFPIMEKLIKETAGEGNLIRNMYQLIQTSSHFLPLTMELIEREKPDYIMFDSLASWGMLAAKKLKLPHVGIVSTFVIDTKSPPPIPAKTMLDMLSKLIVIFPQYVIEALRFRQKHGMFPVWLFEAVLSLGEMNIVFTSREVQPNGVSFPDNFKFIGTAIEARPDDSDFPFDELRGSPLVYISLGTLAQNVEFFKRCFAAFAHHEGQFIVSTGRQQDIAALGDIPDNFIVQNFVPQLELLSKVDVFITHGGLNSIHEGLVFGVPMIVIPQQMEQAINAQQVDKNKAGIALQIMPPYRDVSVEDLQSSLKTILSSSEYAQNAKRLGETLKNAGGVKRAVDEILAFVT